MTIGRNKARISGSCSSNHPKCMPTGIVKNKSASFTICLLHKNVINWGTKTRCVLYYLLSLAFNNKSNVFSIAAGEVSHNKLSPLLFSSTQIIISSGVNVSPHHNFIQVSSFSDLTVTTFPKGKNCRGPAPPSHFLGFFL